MHGNRKLYFDEADMLCMFHQSTVIIGRHVLNDAYKELEERYADGLV